MNIQEIKTILEREKKEIENPVLTINDGIIGWENEDHISRSSEVVKWEELEDIEDLRLE
jgi:hypothetical protein